MGQIISENRRRSDLRLLGRAIREGWKIPATALDSLPAEVITIIEDKGSSTRDRLRAIEVMLKMHKQNVDFSQIAEPIEEPDEEIKYFD